MFQIHLSHPANHFQFYVKSRIFHCLSQNWIAHWVQKLFINSSLFIKKLLKEVFGFSSRLCIKIFLFFARVIDQALKLSGPLFMQFRYIILFCGEAQD